MFERRGFKGEGSLEEVEKFFEDNWPEINGGGEVTQDQIDELDRRWYARKRIA